MECRLSSNVGGFYVEIEASFIGADLLITCTGGDQPHIGAVAVASLTGAVAEPDVRLIALTGHREDELARNAAEKICVAIGGTVTFVAGMHWDDIDRAGIEQVLLNVDECVDGLLQRLTVRCKEM